LLTLLIHYNNLPEERLINKNLYSGISNILFIN
jgi:hypothetical protein